MNYGILSLVAPARDLFLLFQNYWKSSLIINILAILAKLQEIISRFSVAVFKTIMIFISFGCFNYMCKKAEVITESKESIFVDF